MPQVNFGPGQAHPIKTAKTKLTKLSICPCGFSLLNDDITLGTEYLIYPESIDPNRAFVLGCGGCGRRLRGVGSLMAKSVLNPSADAQLLPLEVFEISLDYVQEVNANV